MDGQVEVEPAADHDPLLLGQPHDRPIEDLPAFVRQQAVLRAGARIGDGEEFGVSVVHQR